MANPVNQYDPIDPHEGFGAVCWMFFGIILLLVCVAFYFLGRTA